METPATKQGFYRLSLKAIIRNDKGDVLVVREKGSDWSLPGGGLDHGEDVKAGFARELSEEIMLQGDFTANLVACQQMYIDSKQAWQMWLIFEVKPEHRVFSVGPDADEIRFIDPREFKDSQNRSEQYVYKFAHKKEYEL